MRAHQGGEDEIEPEAFLPAARLEEIEELICAVYAMV
jgi:hypothetical protein